MPILLVLTLSVSAGETTYGMHDGWRFIVSPLAGVDRNEMTVRQRDTQETMTDTGPMYGLFAMAVHPNWVINNFLFYADVNNTDVWGNLLFANYYADAKAALTWNVGAGYLYHEIRPDRGKIKVEVPMVKAGPVFRVQPLRLSINPYMGYAWEQVSTPGGDQDNDSILYGLTLGWHWRMLQAGVNYYYQDSRDLDENFHTLRARLVALVSPHWGILGRIDYMEHPTTDDLSFLAGPVFVF